MHPWGHRWRHRAAALAVTLGVSLAATATPTHAAETLAAPATGSTIAPQGDEIVFGDGDTSGYHLYAAGPADGWTWHALASIQPGRGEDERWIGQQCLTGDGRWVVAVVAPWSAANSEAGMGAGGLAYAVDTHTGVVRPLAAGVSLAYFNPGCGAGGEVALTSYPGRDQRPTRIGVLDVGSGRQIRSAVVRAEITSAVPAGDRIVGVRGADLVDVTGGRTRVLRRFSGRVTDVTPSAAGGVDLITHTGATGEVWRWTPGGTRRAATGRSLALHLRNGRAGRTVVSGAGRLDAGSGLVAAPAAENPAARRLPAPRPVPATALPQLRLDGAATVRALTTGGGYACAVPRNDMFKQVWQPTAAQVRWAVNQAVQHALKPGLASARPANPEMYTDVNGRPLATGYPSEDFLPIDGAPAVPPLVLYGILAQESNFSQASWHALPGRSANPLIADYYGIGGTGTAVDYSKADCGYGIAQITDGMRSEDADPGDRKVRVAVDYATNIAAAVTILQEKWVQLHDLGMTTNNDDPTKVENWYGAIWAYNSGVHNDPGERDGLGWFNNPANPIYPVRPTFLHNGATEAYGDASTPAHWPYQERVFGWIDVPQYGPDNERRYHGSYDWDDTANPGRFLNTPGADAFCDPAVNHCDPRLAIDQSGDPCPSEDAACWWDKPLNWTNCALSCTTSTPDDAPNGHVEYAQPGTPEPRVTPDPATCSLTGSVSPGASAIVVDDSALDSEKNPARLTPNLMGCGSHASGVAAPASADATFTLLGPDGEDVPATPSSVPAVDLHQIGGGVGGHVFFTHTAGTAYEDTEVRGEWAATLPADTTYGTAYQVKAFVPDLAAATGHATYEIDTGGYAGAMNNTRALRRTIDQGRHTNEWVSLGYYLCGGTADNGPGGPPSCRMTVTLRSITPGDDRTQGVDVAFDAVAFVPVPAGAYVALGDSYSSGEGLGGGDNQSPAGWEEGTDVTQNVPGDTGDLCHRGGHSWPRQVAARMNRLAFVDLTCSGSNLGDVAGIGYQMQERIEGSWIPGVYTARFLGDGRLHASAGDGDDWMTNIPNNDQAGSAFYGEPSSQLQLLRALRPALVTLTVGGNDVGFVDILNTCMHAPPDCLEVYGAGTGHDLLDSRIDSLGDFLPKAYQDIANAAGGADKVYVVTYPGIFAPGDPNDPTASDCTGFLSAQRMWLRPKVTRLAGVIKASAAEAHVHVIDVSGLFTGHEACTPDGYVTLPNVFYVNSWPAVDNWFHPDRAGYDAVSREVASHVTVTSVVVGS